MPLDLSGFANTPEDFKGLYSIANTLQENTRYKQEKDYRNKKEQEQKQQQNKLYNLREIDADTDPTKFKTGEQRFDDYTQKELAAIKNKALTEYINLDPVEAEYKLSQDMQGIIGWHSAVKGNIDKIKTGLTDFNKTYPNINAQKAHELAYLQLGNDFLEKDKDGNIIRKSPDLAKPRDYVSELNTPENLTEIVEDVTPFAKYIQSFKPQKSGAKEYQSKRGYSVKHGYTAEITPFSEIETDADGKPIGAKLQSEDFKYDGGTLKMLPERQYEQMMEVPQVRASIIGMWGKHKKQFEAETGQKITPANEDKMLRGFLYDEIKNNNLDQHFFKPDDAVVTPRVTVNTGGGGDKAAAKADANNWLTNTDAAIKSGDINSINDNFRILERGGRFVNVSAKKNKDGNVEVEYSAPQPDGDLKTFYRTFKNDGNLQNQLKGIYQSMTGEDKVFEYSQPKTTNTPNEPKKPEDEKKGIQWGKPKKDPLKLF